MLGSSRATIRFPQSLPICGLMEGAGSADKESPISAEDAQHRASTSLEAGVFVWRLHRLLKRAAGCRRGESVRSAPFKLRLPSSDGDDAVTLRSAWLEFYPTGEAFALPGFCGLYLLAEPGGKTPSDVFGVQFTVGPFTQPPAPLLPPHGRRPMRVGFRELCPPLDAYDPIHDLLTITARIVPVSYPSPPLQLIKCDIPMSPLAAHRETLPVYLPYVAALGEIEVVVQVDGGRSVADETFKVRHRWVEQEENEERVGDAAAAAAAAVAGAEETRRASRRRQGTTLHPKAVQASVEAGSQARDHTQPHRQAHKPAKQDYPSTPIGEPPTPAFGAPSRPKEALQIADDSKATQPKMTEVTTKRHGSPLLEALAKTSLETHTTVKDRESAAVPCAEAGQPAASATTASTKKVPKAKKGSKDQPALASFLSGSVPKSFAPSSFLTTPTPRPTPVDTFVKRERAADEERRDKWPVDRRGSTSTVSGRMPPRLDLSAARRPTPVVSPAPSITPPTKPAAPTPVPSQAKTSSIQEKTPRGALRHLLSTATVIEKEKGKMREPPKLQQRKTKKRSPKDRRERKDAKPSPRPVDGGGRRRHVLGWWAGPLMRLHVKEGRPTGRTERMDVEIASGDGLAAFKDKIRTH
ncbi:unnamed protein product [Vitrella brassicaformis CCMP3155]|uniref:Uncharacterized protein n=3 Tax=Vitrella brassicaformis TaxID=1169539 RepID=A0A0G4F9P7_VITBC|nr:unnamed protein product [Vitrella brassicaformis CCMP3155]|eukprot:CEM09537.1 unnamed protein product [Vitrella brassicaformis CCMP3155]